MQLQFATAQSILFGPGTVSQVPELARRLGARPLVVSGRSPRLALSLVARLCDSGLTCTTFSVAGEPTLAAARDGTRLARETSCDLVIAIGGGSVLDAGKAIAALATNPGDPLDYLEVIGRGRPLERPSLPMVAIPTTAGTGSEVTRNAVLASPEHGIKASLRSPHLLPAVALVDPKLAFDLPPDLTAATGMDALTQLIEPFVCTRANPLTDALCRAGIPLPVHALPVACREPQNEQARSDLALAALLGGMALANAGLGAAHGLAAVLGGAFHAPHGALCARLLPPVMQANIAALRRTSPGCDSLARYDETARLVTGSPQASAEDGAAAVVRLVDSLSIPRLRDLGIPESAFRQLATQALAASSMKANPAALSLEQLEEILSQAA